MSALNGKTILLILSGGIAVYKSLDLIRRLKEDGARVRCILTEGGAKFVTPLAVAALSNEECYTDLFAPEEENRMGHIRLSREADLILIAPASANLMARMAHGMADDLASAVLLAAGDKPILLAPAMNVRMWRHPATQANLALLEARGARRIGPARGALACGEDGEGRMSEIADILEAVRAFFSAAAPLRGRRALVTSGPTFEPLDPVRFIGNRSSGKQGHAIAAALAAQGAEVTLVAGPVALPDPAGVAVLHVETAREMLAACEKSGPFDIAICAAAVADWRPAEEAAGKIKKIAGSAPQAIALTENPDILATLSQASATRPRLVVGFAAETSDIEAYAREKRARKGCDWILANSVAGGQTFGEDENEVVLIRADGAAERWPRLTKKALAERLVEEIAKAFSA